MTEEERTDLYEFVKKFKDYLNEIPDGISKEEPRYVFIGEIIPGYASKTRWEKDKKK